MNIVVIYAHAKEHSTSSALLTAFSSGCRTAKHKLHVIDLYKENFDPLLKEEQLKQGYRPAGQVKRYQELVKKADWLVFIYPIWWFGPPAILKGWFDRVFTSGFAFRYKKITRTIGKPIGLLPVKKAVVIDTYGAPGWATKLLFFNMPWQAVKRGILKLCGIKKFIHYPCYSAPYASTKKRHKWNRDVERIAEKLS